jgi:toxin ParE1/3/4
MARLRLSALARADIVNVLSWTAQRFGDQARARYEQLLAKALRDLSAEPRPLGSAARPELGDGVRSYHLQHSRKRSEVARPRHLILCRIAEGSIVEVGRVQHNAMEQERHVAFDFPSEP